MSKVVDSWLGISCCVTSSTTTEPSSTLLDYSIEPSAQSRFENSGVDVITSKLFSHLFDFLMGKLTEWDLRAKLNMMMILFKIWHCRSCVCHLLLFVATCRSVATNNKIKSLHLRLHHNGRDFAPFRLRTPYNQGTCTKNHDTISIC